MSTSALQPLWSISATADAGGHAYWQQDGDVLVADWVGGEVAEFVQMSNARLLDLAARHAPPQAWFDADEEDLF